MVVLFDETETKFDSLGLGVLKDATQCTVEEELNGSFELEMQYSISGPLYNKLKLNRIIYAKANPFDEPQPFRISNISKPIKGYVKVSAKHISYDMNGIPVKAIDAQSLADVFNKIKENSLVQNNFNFRTNINSGRSFKTTQPFNMRAILMGDDEESLVGVYDAELKFDKFDTHLLSKRGSNRGAKICYGQNMTDITHELTDERLYNGIFPYYHKESVSTETETEETFKQVYIVGTKEYAEDWLSFTENGAPYHPLDSTPVQIASDGNHKEEVYAWNDAYQRYEKKIYNESVTLVENLISPGWIKIVWSSFPNVKCVANAKGYYKLMTDTDWGEIKGVGDVIFDGNILKEGLVGMATNLIIYYSEVIPSTKESTTKEVNDIKEVTLDDPIIWLNTVDSKSMAHDRILLVDLTDKFDDDEPTKEQLKVEADKYISEYKLGNMTTNTKVSFIEVNENQNKFKNFTHIELGDTVQIIYNDAGVNTELRVISTNFDAISEKYISVELGTKKDKLSTQSVENGDNITSLTNDAGYADVTTVNKLIAQTVSADFINAANATLSKAQIDELKVSKIEMPGVIEASQYVIDKLVANLLTANNAKIAETLEAGEVKINGKVNIYGGSISISDEDSSNSITYFNVDSNGNVKANSVEITGGSLSIGELFSVDNAGNLQAKDVDISGSLSIESGEISIGGNNKPFQVTSDGKLTNNNALINELSVMESIKLSDGTRDPDDKFRFKISGNTPININTGSAGFIIGDDDGQSIITQCEFSIKVSAPTYISGGAHVSNISIKSSHNVPLPKNITIKAKILKNGVMSFETVQTSIVIDANSTSASGSIAYPRSQSSTIWNITSISINGGEFVEFPGYDTSIESSENVEVPSNNNNEKSLGNFYPSMHDSLDLGAANKAWRTVYAINGHITNGHIDNVISPNDLIRSSDRNLKENINDISEQYSEMFDMLRPVSYKLKGSEHDRLHLGFIAQEVEQAMTEVGLTSSDFGGLCYDIDENQNKKYSLRYGEFIALNTLEIQKLKKRIELLEKKEEQTE